MTEQQTGTEFVLLGHPIGHSMSPAIHHAVYARYGLPHRYSVVDCRTEVEVRAQVERLRRGEIGGANVTVPWKKLALALADDVDPTAADTGAANVLRQQDGRVVAHNTDVGALCERLKASLPTAGGHAVVLGNGGAALAAVVAARRAGADEVIVTARSWLPSLAQSSWPYREQFEALGARSMAWDPTSQSALMEAACGASLIIQATSAGMLGTQGGETVVELLPWQRLRSDVFLYDVVYNPPVTPLLHKARALSLACEGGLSMLVGQAALAVELWLAVAAPRAEMRAAAERALLGVA